MNTSEEIRTDFIEEIYEKKDFKFIEKYLNQIDEKVKNRILQEEYKNGNEVFLHRNFDKLPEGEIKDKIINKEWNSKNIDFLCEKYEWINDSDMREKIQRLAFKEEKKDFLKNRFEELPHGLQLEAVIKFKDLGISKQRKLELLMNK